MIINVAHTKGGVGKTTIAVNLAIEMKSDLFDLLTNARKETILNDNEKCSKILLFRRMGRAEEEFLFCTPGRGIDGECLFH